MEEKFGLITGVECNFKKSEPETIKAIAKRLDRKYDEIKEVLRYNILTVEQFCDLSELARSTVDNKTRPLMNKETGQLETELDFCYPFRGLKKMGPKFIVRNEKSERYLK